MKARKILVTAVVALTLAAFAGGAAAEELWLHVKVDGGDSEKVTVNLPLSIVEKAVPMIPAEALEAQKVVFDETEMTIDDLRALWADLKSKPDFTMVTVEDGSENVEVKKAGEYLLVNVRGDSEKVDVRIPVAVVDALLSGEGGELDIKAALMALADHGSGELVTVNEGEETVRVWVDGNSESR